jgi:CubicO group peptidase (beta-lactamase class C family)
MALPVPVPPLTDGVVTLRPPDESDLPAIEQRITDPEVVRWFGASEHSAQTVRPRLAQTDDQGPLRTGVDNIRFEPSSALDLVLHRLTDEETLAGLETWLREETAADRFSGAVLVAKDGEGLFLGAYGLGDRELQIPNTLETRFRIGSMNKMFTAVAVLQLVEADQVELTAPLGTYLTDYPNHEVAERVTIHHLLTHTGGTGDIFGLEFDAHREELRTLGDYVELYGGRGLEFEPGTRWAYSNYGFILLGAAIEAVTGQSYYDFVNRHIYEPGLMTRTGSLPEERSVPDRAIGYMDPSGVTDWRPNTDTLPYRGTSAGGGYATVEDFARFAEALLNHELLSPESTELLITGKEEIGPGVEYAYGFADRRDAEGNRSVGHAGGAPGMNGDLRISQSRATSWSSSRTWIRRPPSGSPTTSTSASRSTDRHAHRASGRVAGRCSHRRPSHALTSGSPPSAVPRSPPWRTCPPPGRSRRVGVPYAGGEPRPPTAAQSPSAQLIVVGQAHAFRRFIGASKA